VTAVEVRHSCPTRNETCDEKDKIFFGFVVGSRRLSWIAGTTSATRCAVATATTFPASSEITRIATNQNVVKTMKIKRGVKDTLVEPRVQPVEWFEAGPFTVEVMNRSAVEDGLEQRWRPGSLQATRMNKPSLLAVGDRTPGQIRNRAKSGLSIAREITVARGIGVRNPSGVGSAFYVVLETSDGQ
jgi:hypothetical protein